MKNPTWRLMLLCSALIAVASGCTRYVETKAEHKISDLLPRYLGPADRYTTHVSGRADAMMRGRLRSVHIEGINVRLTPLVTVSRLTLELSDISVDRSKNKLEKIGETRFAARLTEGAINRFVVVRHSTLHDLSISLGEGGKVTVTARPELLGYPTVPVSVRGTVRIEPDGKHLDFIPDAVQVNVGVTIGTALPGFVTDYVASQVNPITDISDAPIPIIADTVIVERGAATITGYVPGDTIRELIDKAGQ